MKPSITKAQAYSAVKKFKKKRTGSFVSFIVGLVSGALYILFLFWVWGIPH